MSGGLEVYWTGDGREGWEREEESRFVILWYGTAKGLRLRGGNLVDIQTGSTVHWRLAFITMGDYAGLRAQQGDE